MANLNCPNCGGAIEGVSPLIRSIDCPYCSSWLRLSNQLWEASDGQKSPLDAPAFLLVGMSGRAPDGTQYTIRGRLRFQYGLEPILHHGSSLEDKQIPATPRVT